MFVDLRPILMFVYAVAAAVLAREEFSFALRDESGRPELELLTAMQKRVGENNSGWFGQSIFAECLRQKVGEAFEIHSWQMLRDWTT